jgi:hypothetical protein
MVKAVALCRSRFDCEEQLITTLRELLATVTTSSKEVPRTKVGVVEIFGIRPKAVILLGARAPDGTV